MLNIAKIVCFNTMRASLSLSFILLITIVTLCLIKNVASEDCDSGRGECVLPSNCEPLRISVSLIRFKFCAQPSGTICCPKRKNTPVFTEDLSKPAIRACKEYREQVYKDCGVQPFIIDGIEAKPREMPHMAYIGVIDPVTRQFNGHCGGTLVAPRFVLTAAHCFLDDIATHVRLGELDWSTDKDDARPVDIAINRTIYPPAYDVELKYNDIVLLELKTEAILSEYVVPACMTLNSGEEYNKFIVAGWGATKKLAKSPQLLKAYLERFNYDECSIRFDIGGGLSRGVVNRTQICAGSHHTDFDTCVGDSGGPLFRQHPKYPCMYEVVGITSLGTVCGKQLPGLYTRVGLYKDWIEQVIWDVALHV